MAASASLSTAAAMSAVAFLLSAVDVAGPSSSCVRRGGGAGSGGRLTMENLTGLPEAGCWMGVEMSFRSRRQASCNTARVSAAGRTATEPHTTTLGVVDMARVRRGFALQSGKNFGMKKNSVPASTDDF